MKPIDSIVSSEYPAIYMLLPNIIVIIVNTSNINITDINDDIVSTRLMYSDLKNK